MKKYPLLFSKPILFLVLVLGVIAHTDLAIFVE